MAKIIKKLGPIQDVCMEDYIINFFSDFNMQNQSIVAIDPTLAKFQNLKVLNLSFNNIRKIEHLPANLEELYLNGNQINEVSISAAKPLKSVIHVGLNMNKLRQPALTQLVKVFPNLFCLDVSFNDLCDLQTTVAWLKNLGDLKMLSVEGNPLILAPNCSNVLKEALPGLKMLDGNTIFHDKNGDSKKNALKTSSTLTRR